MAKHLAPGRLVSSGGGVLPQCGTVSALYHHIEGWGAILFLFCVFPLEFQRKIFTLQSMCSSNKLDAFLEATNDSSVTEEHRSSGIPWKTAVVGKAFPDT